jgi:hypothetical protein
VQCEIHIQQKFFPNAAQLVFNGQKIVVKVLLFELSFSSNEQKLVQKLFFVDSRIDQLSYRPAAGQKHYLFYFSLITY